MPRARSRRPDEQTIAFGCADGAHHRNDTAGARRRAPGDLPVPAVDASSSRLSHRDGRGVRCPGSAARSPARAGAPSVRRDRATSDPLVSSRVCSRVRWHSDNEPHLVLADERGDLPSLLRFVWSDTAVANPPFATEARNFSWAELNTDGLSNQQERPSASVGRPATWSVVLTGESRKAVRIHVRDGPSTAVHGLPRHRGSSRRPGRTAAR
jgi:hypothetical protein